MLWIATRIKFDHLKKTSSSDYFVLNNRYLNKSLASFPNILRKLFSLYNSSYNSCSINPLLPRWFLDLISGKISKEFQAQWPHTPKIIQRVPSPIALYAARFINRGFDKPGSLCEHLRLILRFLHVLALDSK